MYEKSWSYNVCFLRYRVQQTWFFCHFGPFFALLSHYWHWKLKTGYYPFTHSYHKWRSYDLWFLRYEAQQTEFFVILDHFLPFHPPNNTKNQNFEKMKKKKHLVILSFYTCCTTNDNYMTYGSWDMEHNRVFPHFGLFFALLLPPLTTQKIKIFKT